MINFKVDVAVKIDKSKIKSKVLQASKESIKAAATQGLKDSNLYVRQDTGDLKDSSITSSRIDEGKLIWNKPYAAAAYYIGNPSKDKNPNATLMWAHEAAARHGSQWNKIAQKAFKEGMNKL